MNIPPEILTYMLLLAAAGQFMICVLSLFLSRLLHWKEDIARMPLLIREVFLVHGYFIAITVAFFAVMTFRFADDLALGRTEIGRWFAGGVGIFWAVRCIMQWTVYSASHWRGQKVRALIHWTLFIGYAGFASAYLLAAISP